MFETTLSGQTFSLSQLPLLGLAIAASVAWGGPLLAGLFAARSDASRGCLPALAAGMFGGFTAAFVGIGGTLAVLFFALPPDKCLPGASCDPALHAFTSLQLAVFAGISMLATVWGLTFAAIGFSRFHPAAAVSALAWVALTSLGAIPVVFQLGSLARIGPLPRAALDGPPFVHEQRAASFEVRIVHPYPERVTLPARLDVPPSDAGTFRVTLDGAAGPLSFSLPVEVRVAAERGHPQFPLRTGNRWVYAPFFESGASPRVLFDGGRRSRSVDHSRTLNLTVGSPTIEDGVRWFPVRIVTPEAEEVVKVAAVDGEVRLEDGKTFVGGNVDPTASFGSFSTCTLRPLEAYGRCRCPDRIGGIVDRPPGPSRCSTQSGGGFLEGLIRGVTMIASVGIIDPGSSKRVRGIELVDFERGPDDAPAAEPDWVFTPEPKIIAARKALEGKAFESDKVPALKRAVAGTTDLSCDAAEVILLGQPFFHQDDLLVVLAPHMTDPLACDRLITQMAQLQGDADSIRGKLREAMR